MTGVIQVSLPFEMWTVYGSHPARDFCAISASEGRTTQRMRRHPGLGSFRPGPFTCGMCDVMEMKTVCWTVAVTRLAPTPPAITKTMLLSSVCQVMAWV